jgi:hypothetical protein
MVIIVIYKQSYADVKERLKDSAFGMVRVKNIGAIPDSFHFQYRLIWESPNMWKPSDNSFASWKDKSSGRAASQSENNPKDEVSLLHYPPEDMFSYTSIDANIPPFQMDSDTLPHSGIEGLWTGLVRKGWQRGTRIGQWRDACQHR